MKEERRILAYTVPLVVTATIGDRAFRFPLCCPYCHLALQEQRDVVLQRAIWVRHCSCGWWYVLEENDHRNDGFFTAAICGALAAYAPSAADVPVEVLRTELPQHPEVLYAMHPERLERLVGEILRGVYGCEVVHVGRSGDGGVDLLLLHSDDPIAVQVKRRSSPHATERVAPIRELVGATLLKGLRRAVFATTAERFTSAAQEAATMSTMLGLLRSYELMDVDKIRYYATTVTAAPLWHAALDPSHRWEWRRCRGIGGHRCFEDLLADHRGVLDDA